MKVERDAEVVEAIGKRFCELLNLLPGSLSSASKLLGYKKPSTVYTIKKGKTLPDMVRLKTLAEQQIGDGLKPNIHWLVTGEGDMLVAETTVAQSGSSIDKICSELAGQPEEKLQAILTLLKHN